MTPFIAIAASLLPEILKSVIGKKSETAVDAVTKAVKAATGFDGPAEAQKKIETDPVVEKELRIKLAEIAAEEEEKERQKELEAQRLQIQKAESKQKAEMDALKLRIDEDTKKRKDDFRRLEAGIADTQSARTTFSDMAKASNPFAWGPVIVSLIVTIGFFTILMVLLWQWTTPGKVNNDISQIINIAIGALTAGFATVVAFWLGSSQGSRNKDFASAETQAQNARATEKVIERQALHVTSRTVGWFFLEQLRFAFMPVFHGVQGRLATQG